VFGQATNSEKIAGVRHYRIEADTSLVRPEMSSVMTWVPAGKKRCMGRQSPRRCRPGSTKADAVLRDVVEVRRRIRTAIVGPEAIHSSRVESNQDDIRGRRRVLRKAAREPRKENADCRDHSRARRTPPNGSRNCRGFLHSRKRLAISNN